MTGSIVAGLIVAVAIPIVLAIRSRNSVRWFLGVFQPRFPSGVGLAVRLVRVAPRRPRGRSGPAWRVTRRRS